MLGPRDPDEYLLPTERRVIRVRLHWISLTRVLVETVAILIAAIGLSALIEDGVTLESFRDTLTLPLILLILLILSILLVLLILLSLLGAVGTFVLNWFGRLGPARRFGDNLQQSWVKRAIAALVGAIVVLGVAWILQQRGGVQAIWPLQTILWYATLAAVGRFAYRVLEWWVERVVVTDKRFMITSGIIETKISLMPITKVTDMSYTRPIVGRILGYGTLRVESAGQKQDLERIDYLPRPETVYDGISELIFGEKGQGRAPSLVPPRVRSRRR